MANPKTAEAQQAHIDQNPFDGMHIDDNTILDRLEGRHPCPSCGKSRKFFCYTCYVPLEPLQGKLPKIHLPVKIDIIKHRNEIDGKSTAAHAALLAPDDVSIYTYPNIPDYSKEDGVILIFPSQTAITVSSLCHKVNAGEILSCQPIPRCPPEGTMKTTIESVDKPAGIATGITQVPVKKAVFIDSTWKQCRGIYKDERLRKIPCVVIQNRISQFWRHQKGSPRWYLATVEAIHQFLIELHLNCWGLNPDYKGIRNCFHEFNFEGLYKQDQKSYVGQYDNLLYFFKHMYGLIHACYDHDLLYAYKRRLM